MTEFSNALAQYLQGQLDDAGLEAALENALRQDPGNAQTILQTLDQLFRSSRLPARLYISLKQKVEEGPSQAPASSEPTPVPPSPPVTAPPAAPLAQEPPTPEPPAPAPPDQVSDEHSDILDILQAPGDEPPVEQRPPGFVTPPPPQEPASPEPPPGEPEPSEDKTVFRQSAPPAGQSGQSSQPGTGTGAGYQTGHTGAGGPTGPTGPSRAMTGPTGASIPTGTGSSWTDPAKWGEGPAPTMQPGSVLKERYVLESVIGRGGMGVVFKARDMRREEAQDRNPHVAVKILNDEFRRHPESLKALQRESRKAQDLAHPNIVTVFDFDRDGQIVYMTMEFLEGQSLDRLTKDATFDGMPLEEAYPLIEGLGNALSYAHRKGVVHSDFKPANTFLTKEGVIKVFDFGIARAAKLPGQKSGEMTLFDPGSLGALTPAYASCEMIDGEEPDARDDIYALACLAYELLTGRHPFDKRPATEARDKGLTVKPIDGLSRRNWRGLQRGLAFRREDRSPSIEHFLEDLKVRKLNKTLAAVGVAAAVAVIALIAVQVPAYLEERRIENLVASILDGDDAQISVVLDELNAAEENVREEVISDGQVEDRLIDYYYMQITNAEAQLDYPRAEALLAEAELLYDDSRTLGEARDALEESKATLLADLNRQFEAHLEAGRILPSDGEDIIKVLDAYALIDPNHEALTDSRLAIAYANMAREILAADDPQPADILQAETVVNVGLERFPADATLNNLRDNVNTLRDVQDKQIRVAELEQQLEEALASMSELQDVRPYEQALSQLDTLDPSNQVAARLRGRIESLAVTIIDTALADNDWILARSTLDDYSTVLRQDYVAAARGRIDAAASEYDDRVGGVYANIADAVQAGDFEQAVSNLGQLEQLNAAPGTISQAREIITRGYLSAAQTERAAGGYDAARALIEDGRRVDPAYAGWQEELVAISSAERLEGDVLAEQERARLEQEKQARIDSLAERVRSSLARSPLGVDGARSALASIDELARIDPANELARTGRREVAAKLATEARGLGSRDQNYDGALALIAQSMKLLPAEQALRQAQSDLQAQRQEYLARSAEERAGEFKANLDRLLASPSYDSEWDAGLRRSIQGLEPRASDATYVRDKREEVANLYVARAKALRSEERFDLAERMLVASEWFVSDHAAANQERQALVQERQEFEAAARERNLAARVQGLKRTFTTELNAENFQQARAALSQLGNLVPSGDSFVASEAPRAIADAYLKIASRRLASNEFDEAEQFARQGLREVGDHAALTELIAEIRPKRLQRNRAELEELIKSAAPTDAARPKSLLSKVRTDAGSAYSGIESELRELANRRVAASKSERDAVVGWLSQIFAGYMAPALAGPPCGANLAGYGSRGSRAQCYDYLPGSSDEGPRLVVVPAGNGVAQPYAITRLEISVGEWNAYCRLSGNCQPRAGQSERLPITNIAANDAKAYADWLSAGTKHKYRLPTAPEWEHAANSNGGAPISPNCINRAAGLLGDAPWEVDHGGQNAWGLKNYIGNAQEWVLGPSGAYEARGGAYNDQLGACKVSLSRPHAGNADAVTGFRLVRNLGEGA